LSAIGKILIFRFSNFFFQREEQEYSEGSAGALGRIQTGSSAVVGVNGIRLRSWRRLRKEASEQEVYMQFIHSFIPDISIAPLQVHYYSEALLTTALTLCRS